MGPVGDFLECIMHQFMSSCLQKNDIYIYIYIDDI